MADFEHRATIGAEAETVRRLLAERGADWWTTDAVVDGKPGGVSTFRLPQAGFFVTVRVKTNEPGLFVWECLDSRNEQAAGTAYERLWVGSTIRFSITSDSAGPTELELCHSGLAYAADDGFWGFYMDSLKALAETGRGSPWRAMAQSRPGAYTTKGSCLCGAVSFELDPAGIVWANGCYCSNCRKVSGSQFLIYLHVLSESFRWLSGEDEVGAFESSPGVRRCFCRVCGSVAPVRGYSLIGVPGGALDNNPGVTPEFSIFASSKAGWCAADAAPGIFPTGPPAGFGREINTRIYKLMGSERR